MPNPNYSSSGNPTSITHTKTTFPTVDDDTAYNVGDVWLDTTNDNAFVCLDNTNGAAVWSWMGRPQPGYLTETLTTNLKCHYKFDGDLTNSYGNPGTMGITRGATFYGMVAPGVRGLFGYGGDVHNVSHADLRLADDMTAIYIYNRLVGGDASGLSFTNEQAGAGIYNVRALSGSNYSWEFAQTNEGWHDTNIKLSPYVPYLIAYTRISNVLKLYINGDLMYTSGTMTDPDDAQGAEVLYVHGGSNVGYEEAAGIASLQIYNAGLTAAQIKQLVFEAGWRATN